MVSVSQTSDPTGNWNLYRFDVDSADDLWADYPTAGFNKKWIVVQANLYTSTGWFSGSRIWIFNKSDLYAGGSGQHTKRDVTYVGGIFPATTSAVCQYCGWW